MKFKTAIKVYKELNEKIFDNVLFIPLFATTRRRYEYASYEAWEVEYWYKPSLIRLNLKNLNASNIVETIYHEMIHQYIEEFLNLTEEDHHGEIFQRNYNLFRPNNIGVYIYE